MKPIFIIVFFHPLFQIQEKPEGILHRPPHLLDQDDDLVVHDVHGAGHQDEGPLAARRRASLLGHRQGPARDSRLHHRVRYGGKKTYICFECSFSCKTNQLLFILDERHSLLPTRHQHVVTGVLREVLNWQSQAVVTACSSLTFVYTRNFLLPNRS